MPRNQAAVFMTFLFRWKHKDGGVVEFSQLGWKSDDPEKSRWLVHMSELCSSSPVLAPAIRLWLQENCRLVEFVGPEDALMPIKVPQDSGSELPGLQALARAANAGISPNFSVRTSIFRRNRRNGV
jgi:hypothetical protein